MQLSIQDILADINSFKVRTVQLALETVQHQDSKYLEPRELKTLTDVMLSIEDSLANNTNEGEQARKIQRVLEKYNTPSYVDVNMLVQEISNAS